MICTVDHSGAFPYTLPASICIEYILSGIAGSLLLHSLQRNTASPGGRMLRGYLTSAESPSYPGISQAGSQMWQGVPPSPASVALKQEPTGFTSWSGGFMNMRPDMPTSPGLWGDCCAILCSQVPHASPTQETRIQSPEETI